jgi:hypothetical protein
MEKLNGKNLEVQGWKIMEASFNNTYGSLRFDVRFDLEDGQCVCDDIYIDEGTAMSMDDEIPMDIAKALIKANFPQMDLSDIKW